MQPINRMLKHTISYLPFLLLLGYLGVFVLFYGRAPTAQDVLDRLIVLYKTHGYLLIFIGAYFEGVLLLGFYVPGSTVMLLGAALAKTGIVSFPLAYGTGLLGLTLAYSTNYLLGRFGWYHLFEKFGLQEGMAATRQKLITHKRKTMFFGYIYPGSAAFVATAAGVLRMPFQEFIFWSVISQGFWGLVWGGIAYFFGVTIIDVIMKYFLLAIILVGLLWLGKRWLRLSS